MIRTRFAPSPTGYLHVGGVRTAIFNWAYARRHGGEFYLRIDDTDAGRHVEDAVIKIIEGLKWIGLDWDVPSNVNQGVPGNHGPVKDLMYQSLRGFEYISVQQQLLDKEIAYKCFCTTQELEDARKQAESKGLFYQYNGKCRHLTAKDRERYYAEGRPWCVRLNVDAIKTNRITFTDEILGEITRDLDKDPLGDFVIVRPNGTPLYNFATVVDDIDMKITHIIRGQEHIGNTFPQIMLYTALGKKIPTMAHIPFICSPKTSKKMSKRDGGATLEEYQAAGYLPDAIFNYLSHLGWSLDDKTEKWSKQQLIDNFCLERITKSSATFDPPKLLWLQSEYFKELSIDQKVEFAIPYLGDNKEMVARIIKAAGDRLKTIQEVSVYQHFIDDKYEIDLEAVEKRIVKTNAKDHLVHFCKALGEFENWTAEKLEELLGYYCEAADIKPALLIHALRVATTGKMVGFGVFEGMEILGKVRTLSRIARLLDLQAKTFGVE